MLSIEHRRVNDVIILDLTGRITPGDPERMLATTVRSAIRQGYRKMVLNLAEATTSDTSGISALVDAYLQMRAVGGELKLMKIERRYAQLLIVVALYTYFDVFESEQQALASFRVSSLPSNILVSAGLTESRASSVGA